jgi:hypothetical protein
MATRKLLHSFHETRPYKQQQKNAYGISENIKKGKEKRRATIKNIKLPNRISNSSDFRMQCCGVFYSSAYGFIFLS